MIRTLELANFLYRLFYVLGFVTIFVFNGFYSKKYNIKPAKSVVFSILSYILIFAWAYVLAWVENGFEWGHHNAIRVYIWMPLIIFVMSKLFSIEWSRAIDYIAPSTCIVYGIARIGCLFTGCCYGIRCEWGIFSTIASYNVFPVQLCEAITSLAIAYWCIYNNRKHNYNSHGYTYPTMLVLYGYSRFIWEFLADNTKILFGVISSLAIWAFATGTIGVIWLLILKLRNKIASQT